MNQLNLFHNNFKQKYFMKTVIEVQQFGDYDRLYRKCIMVSTKKYRKNDLLQEFYQIVGDTFISDELDFVTNEFIKFLESKEFTELKTEQIYFSD